MTDKHNESYDNIKIPDEKLLLAINAGIKKGKIEKIKISVKKISSIAASFLITAFVISNIPFIYSEAGKVPVIGDFVKAMHIGRGGAEYSGGKIATVLDKNTIEIKYLKKDVEENFVKPYIIDYHTAPYRIVLSMKDISKDEFKNLKKQIESIEGVDEVYQVEPKQEGYLGFNIILKKFYNYEVMEFKNPGKLIISVFQDAYFTKNDIHPDQEMYIVTTEEYKNIKDMKDFEDIYKMKDSSVLKTKDNNFVMVVGEFKSQEEAEEKIHEFSKKYSDLKLSAIKIKASEKL